MFANVTSCCLLTLGSLSWFLYFEFIIFLWFVSFSSLPPPSLFHSPSIFAFCQFLYFQLLGSLKKITRNQTSCNMSEKISVRWDCEMLNLKHAPFLWFSQHSRCPGIFILRNDCINTSASGFQIKMRTILLFLGMEPETIS